MWERGGPINIFTTGGGYGRGRASLVTARGSGGALLAPPVAPEAFLLLRLFSSDIQYKHHAISGLLEPALAWIATRKLFIFRKAMVPTATS